MDFHWLIGVLRKEYVPVNMFVTFKICAYMYFLEEFYNINS